MASNPQRAVNSRRHDLDLLHVLACFGVFLSHVLLIFGPYPLYHLKNSTVSQPVGIAYEFFRDVPVTLFFMLSGWSSMTMVRSSGARSFLRKRFLRLVIPLFAGILLLCPPIKYIELLSGRDLTMAGMRMVEPIHLSFLQFLPEYFTRSKLATWSHLWFLVYLILYCILFLPVLAMFARTNWKTAISRLPGWTAYMPFVPLGLLLVGLGGWWPYYPRLWGDWVNLCYFGILFLLGAFMEACPAFELSLRRNWAPLGLIGLAGFVGLVLQMETNPGRFLVAVTTWGCACASIGLAWRLHPAESKVIAYLRDASMPVYVLHHTAVLVIGWYVVRLDIGITAKIAVLLPLAVLTTFTVYECLVRRVAMLRLLFGMPPHETRSEVIPSCAPRAM